jgi:hypothetical protein
MLYKYLLENLLLPTSDVLSSVWKAANLDSQLKFTQEFKQNIISVYGTEDLMLTLQQANTLELLGEAWQEVMCHHSFAIENILRIIYHSPSSEEAFGANRDFGHQSTLEAMPQKCAQKANRWNKREEELHTYTLVDTAMKGSYSVLGIKPFRFSQATLDAHINYVLEWWTGKRTPVGVDVQNTGRCRYLTSHAGLG